MNEKREEIQKLALAATIGKSACTLVVSMRVGKTYIGLQYLNMNFPETGKLLIVAPKLEIFNGWIADAEKFNLGHLLSRIKFTTYISLYKQDTDYAAVILDEVHSLTNTSKAYLSTHKGKILGLTGTEPRHPASEKYRLIDKYCPVAYRYLTDEAVEDGILNDYRITVHLMNLSERRIVEVKTRTGGVFKQSETDKYSYYFNKFAFAQSLRQQYYNKIEELQGVPTTGFAELVRKNEHIASARAAYNKAATTERDAAMFLGTALMSLPTKERYTTALLKTITNKCIVFANTKDQADRLCDYSHHSGNKASGENLRMFKEGDIQVLSCINQLSEGVTIPNLKECIILHSYGSEKRSPQRLARCLSLAAHEVSQIHVLCFRDTRDEIWVNEALKDLNPDKIEFVDANEYLSEHNSNQQQCETVYTRITR